MHKVIVVVGRWGVRIKADLTPKPSSYMVFCAGHYPCLCLCFFVNVSEMSVFQVPP